MVTYTEFFDADNDGCQPCGESSYSSKGAAACTPCSTATLGSTAEEVEQCRLVLLTNDDAVHGSLGAIGILALVSVALVVAFVIIQRSKRDAEEGPGLDADRRVMVLGATGWIGLSIATEAGSIDGIYVIGSCRKAPENPSAMPFVDEWRECDVTISPEDAARDDEIGYVCFHLCQRFWPLGH